MHGIQTGKKRKAIRKIKIRSGQCNNDVFANFVYLAIVYSNHTISGSKVSLWAIGLCNENPLPGGGQR